MVKFNLTSVVIIIVLSLLAGGLLHSCFFSCEEPVNSITTKTETTTRTEAKQGIPDTTITDKKDSGFARITSFNKNNQEGIRDNATLKARNIAEGNSKFKKTFNLDNADVDAEVTTYPAADSVDINVRVTSKEKIITRVDTVTVSTETKTSEVKVETFNQMPAWLLTIGSNQVYYSGVDVFKYAELSYNHKVWFFYTTVTAGFHNGFSDGLNDFKTHSKIELNIPLN